MFRHDEHVVRYLQEHVRRRFLELEGDLIAAAGHTVERLPDTAQVESGLRLQEIKGIGDIIGAKGLPIVPFHAVADREHERLGVLPLVVGCQPGIGLAVEGVDDHERFKGVGRGQGIRREGVIVELRVVAAPKAAEV